MAEFLDGRFIVNNSAPNPDSWATCPDGELVRITKGLSARHQRRDRRRLFAAVGVVMLIVAAGTYSAGRMFPRSMAAPGGVTCEEVQHVLAQYLAGELPEDQAMKIRQHLAECPFCQEMMNSMPRQTSNDEPSVVVARN